MFHSRLILVGLAAGLLASAVLTASAEEKASKKYMVYVGTYTGGKKSQGIYRLEFDAATGKLSDPMLAAKIADPSFLAIHPTGKFLYAVGESGSSPKKGTGAVNAFAIDAKTGDLSKLNQQSSEGPGPCHIVLDKAGKYAFAANYSGGNACALPIDKDGKLGEATGVAKHDPRGKKKPLAHSINLDAANRFAFVADAGVDRVFVYKFDGGKLVPNDPPHAELPVNAAPRHFAFHPDGKHAYVINESALSITAFDYDADKGELKEIQTISTVPQEWQDKKSGRGSTAEVVVHPSGRFVYGSNRGHDSIAMFSVDAKTGKLTSLGNQGQGVKTPRNFAVDPTGKWCFVGSQATDTLLLFAIDQKTGKLVPTETKASIGAPVCIRFLAWPN